MENSNKIIPPHLNAEIYRTDKTGTNTLAYLDYVRIHKDGSMLVGCSELTGRYWNGGANIYNNVEDAQKLHEESKKCIELSSGTPDGCFIDSKTKVLLCEDNGTVSIWEATPEDCWRPWNMLVSAAEHDDAALAVDCIDPGKVYITAGADGNVKIWDIDDMICTNSIVAHNEAVYGVAVKPNSAKTFATASLDCYLTLWEDYTPKTIAKNDCGIRCLQWLDDNRLVYGDEAGTLRLIDTRMVDARSVNARQVLTEFPAPVHKIEVQSGSNKVAVCCDNKIVSVCTISEKSESTVIYHHDRHMHSNYVRGLAWDMQDTNVLHTIGWNGEIKSHKISM